MVWEKIDNRKKEPNLLESKNWLYNDIKSKLSNLQNFLLYGNQKEQKDKTKEELLSLEHVIIKAGENYKKEKYIVSKDKIEENIKSTKKDLDNLKSSVNPLFEIYKDKDFKNRFDSIAKKFGNNSILSVIKDMVNYKFDVQNPADRWRIDSVLSLFEDTPYFITKNFLL